MKTNTTLPKNLKHGFTLIEVIAVLVLLGILAAIAVPKYIDMADNAKTRAIDAGIAEMNGRELLRWGKAMLADGAFVDTIPDAAGYDLNATGVADADGYEWEVVPSLSPVGGPNGELKFQGSTGVELNRTAGSPTGAASWVRR